MAKTLVIVVSEDEKVIFLSMQPYTGPWDLHQQGKTTNRPTTFSLSDDEIMTTTSLAVSRDRCDIIVALLVAIDTAFGSKYDQAMLVLTTPKGAARALIGGKWHALAGLHYKVVACHTDPAASHTLAQELVTAYQLGHDRP